MWPILNSYTLKVLNFIIYFFNSLFENTHSIEFHLISNFAKMCSINKKDRQNQISHEKASVKLLSPFSATLPSHSSSPHYLPTSPDWPSAEPEYPPPSVYASSPVLSNKTGEFFIILEVFGFFCKTCHSLRQPFTA